MGFFSCCHSRKVQTGTCNRPGISSSDSGQKPKGVSIHWLKNGLLEEVKAWDNLSEKSNIYEIEDLSSEECGVIRSKGKNVVCPRDGRIGAAYVDCLDGKDNVGPATLMLSYGWGYQINDIVDTLLDYCKSSNLQPKKTYVWICCLCNNQHRVVESRNNNNKNQDEDTFEEFQRIFHDRVVDIGHVVALLCPWDNPIYLTRIWCIFELYVASQNDCDLTIAMPPDEKTKMVTALRKPAGVEELYRNLAKTKVENAKASVESDRERILEMVRNGPGFHELNRKVNMLLREWVQKGLMEAVSEYKGKTDDVSLDPDYAYLCNDVGKVMRDSGAYEEASILYRDAISIFKACDDNGTLTDFYRRILADTHNNFGLVLKSKGEYSEGKKEFQKALEIGEIVWSENDYDAAQTYNNIGLALDDMKEYDDALEAYERAKTIVEISLGKDHVNVAGAISNIAYLLEKMGRRDEAIEKMREVIAIDENANGFDHPDTANSYNILGVILNENGDNEDALDQYRKALVVREKVFGKESTLTAVSYHNIGSVLHDLGRYKEALVELNRAVEIFKNSVGVDHPECQATLGFVDMAKKKIADGY